MSLVYWKSFRVLGTHCKLEVGVVEFTVIKPGLSQSEEKISTAKWQTKPPVSILEKGTEAVSGESCAVLEVM